MLTRALPSHYSRCGVLRKLKWRPNLQRRSFSPSYKVFERVLQANWGFPSSPLPSLNGTVFIIGSPLKVVVGVWMGRGVALALWFLLKRRAKKNWSCFCFYFQFLCVQAEVTAEHLIISWMIPKSIRESHAELLSFLISGMFKQSISYTLNFSFGLIL